MSKVILAVHGRFLIPLLSCCVDCIQIMAMSIRRLDAEVSFLLTFEPIVTDTSDRFLNEPFRVLLNPHLARQPTLSLKRRSVPISNKYIADADEALYTADTIVISHASADCCDESTLRRCQLVNPNTIILAAPEAARVIRRWKNFDTRHLDVLQRWEDPRLAGQNRDIRIPLLLQATGRNCGEVTISYIAPRRDNKGQHSAIGITYRPPPEQNLSRFPRSMQTPPTTPKPRMSCFLPQIPTLLPTPPTSPSLRSTRSTASLAPHLLNRAVSLIYAPNGIAFPPLEGYATTHLLNEAALPLTALLHCFDRVDAPWWMSGCVRTGVTTGLEIASALGARLWLDVPQNSSAGSRKFDSLRARMTRRTTHDMQDVRRRVEQDSSSKNNKASHVTAVSSLQASEEVVLTSEGIWEEVEGSNSSIGKSSDLSLYGIRQVLDNLASEPFTIPPLVGNQDH